MKTERDRQESRLKIGAVSRLTGLSVHVLRKWEERYAAVQPIRTPGGERLYTRQDVRRLVMMNRLAQAGAPLSELAQSSLVDLEQVAKSMLDVAPAKRAQAERPKLVRLGVVGAALPTLLEAELGALRGLELVAHADSVATIAEVLEGRAIDLLVYEFPSVHAELAADVSQALSDTHARGAIAVYGFGSREALERLRSAGIVLMRAPIDPWELEHVAIGLMQQLTAGAPILPADSMSKSKGEIPPPRFSREVFARVALSTPAIRCECPHHLADIISSLLAFERYSLECEARNAADAELHHFLAVTAGRSRAAFEDALSRVAEAEGLDLGA